MRKVMQHGLVVCVSLLALAVIVGGVGCGGGGGGGGWPYFVSGKINGKSFKLPVIGLNNGVPFYVNGTYIPMVEVYGSDEEHTQEIHILFPKPTSLPETYTINQGGAASAKAEVNWDEKSFYTSSTDTGTLTITAYDTTDTKSTCRGTFSFKAGTLNVTEGKFYVIGEEEE